MDLKENTGSGGLRDWCADYSSAHSTRSSSLPVRCEPDTSTYSSTQGTSLSNVTPRIAEMLAERAKSGAQVRLCWGEPTSQAVDIRDREEGLRGTLAHKIRALLTYYQELLDVPGCEIRLHSQTLYASLFRYGDTMLANPHIWGAPASANPALQLRLIEGSTWFDGYRRSFDAVWDTALPWEP